MKRKFLFSFYETPQGKLLQIQEKNFLRRSITLGCRQTIVQIGGLEWEEQFIDCSLYSNYYIIDAKACGAGTAIRLQAKSYCLPIQSESVDMVILPHMLEFDDSRFQTMREVERILKPEGCLVILNFNPLSIWVNLHSLWNIRMSKNGVANLISRTRITDWLKLLNFEVKSTAELTMDALISHPCKFKLGKRTFFAMSYAVRAVKRQYTLIPLTPVKMRPAKVIAAGTGIKSTTPSRTNE